MVLLIFVSGKVVLTGKLVLTSGAHSPAVHKERSLRSCCSQEGRKASLVTLMFDALCTGAKKREEIYEAFEAIYPVLQEFRKADTVQADAAQPGPSQGPARALPVRSDLNVNFLSHAALG